MPRQTVGAAALVLALVSSALTGTAQLIAKGGADRINRLATWQDPLALGLLFASYVVLALAFLTFLLALRRGALSTLYPVLAARYVWVVLVTPLFFATELLNVYKVAGAVLTALGVALVAGAREPGTPESGAPESHGEAR